MKALLWPYEEVRIERGQTDFEYMVLSPWLGTKIDTNTEGRELAEKIISADARTPQSDLIKCYSKLLQNLIYEPFCYILPRPPVPHNEDKNVISETAQPEFMDSIEWMWDSKAILQMALIPETELYDPLSLMSIFRRFHRLDALEFEPSNLLLMKFEKLPDPEFPKAATFLAAQTLYITQRCTEVLSAALPLAQKAKPQLQDFIESEKGHDRLLKRAVLSITERNPVDESWTAPAPLTISLMDNLKNVGQSNFLAFAFAITLFEVTDYTKENRVAKIFAKSGLVEAAKMLEMHQSINDRSNHDHVGLDLLEWMPPVSKAYASEAIRWSEYMVRLTIDHSVALLKRIELLSESA